MPSSVSERIGSSVRTGSHLVRRFIGSLSSRPPEQSDEEWAVAMLTVGELGIWQRMSPQDQRHAITVAQDVAARLSEVEAAAMKSGWFDDVEDFRHSATVAALLHDCGKVVSDLGTMARAGATVLWAAAPSGIESSKLARLSAARRLVDYRHHPDIGGRLLVEAGSRPLVSAWAAEHHLNRQRWSVPPEVGLLLKECDDD